MDQEIVIHAFFELLPVQKSIVILVIGPFSNVVLVRAFSSGVSNVKYLAFDTPNTTIQTSSVVLNVSKF